MFSTSTSIYKTFITNFYLTSLFGSDFFYGTFNILRFFPSVGRFLSVASISLFLGSQQNNSKMYGQLILLFLVAIALYIVVDICNTFNYTSYLLFLGNPIIASFIEIGKSMWQLIINIM